MLQVDFLTAELLRHSPSIGSAVYGGLQGSVNGEKDGVSQATALELEVARLATQLRTALGAQQRAEEAVAAMHKEVCLLTPFLFASFLCMRSFEFIAHTA